MCDTNTTYVFYNRVGEVQERYMPERGYEDEEEIGEAEHIESDDDSRTCDVKGKSESEDSLDERTSNDDVHRWLYKKDSLHWYLWFYITECGFCMIQVFYITVQ